jgi:hypothetical protein
MRDTWLVAMAVVALALAGCGADNGANANIGDTGGDAGWGGDVGGDSGAWPIVPFQSCEQHEDCESGLCLFALADSVCAYPCKKNKTCAHKDWKCFGIREGFEEVKELCLPKMGLLCTPCQHDHECAPRDNSTAGLCLDVADEGQFCGAECIFPEDCPLGYTCKAFEKEDGGLLGQCQPKGQVCVCNEVGKLYETAAACVFENEWGKCEGETVCPKSGPAKCTTHRPSEDLCNSFDDNCDGVTDDGGKVGEQCGQTKKGECEMGAIACVEGQEVCQGAIMPAEEICDGLDNDCDTITDESYPEQNAPCGLNIGICVPGKLVCVKAELDCQGEKGPEEEVCNNLDDDCNGKTDDADPACE